MENLVLVVNLRLAVQWRAEECWRTIYAWLPINNGSPFLLLQIFQAYDGFSDRSLNHYKKWAVISQFYLKF